MGDQEQKTKLARIARLSRRLDRLTDANIELRGILKGILDLLADEL